MTRLLSLVLPISEAKKAAESRSEARGVEYRPWTWKIPET
ncbi:MAG: hypothetical protein H6Q07_3217, partial [Acidobacteria bacterium]|nr:hypothetical protein [Acidobacteriota bacterium]